MPSTSVSVREISFNRLLGLNRLVKGVRSLFCELLVCYVTWMPQAKRICPGGTVFHCLNRSVARLTLFEKDGDFEAFERVLEEAYDCVSLRILDYDLTPFPR